jgi:hypothetical protein
MIIGIGMIRHPDLNVTIRINRAPAFPKVIRRATARTASATHCNTSAT